MPLCPFCNLDPTRILLESQHALSFLDAFPLAEGHTLVIPRRHVASLYDLPPEELTAIWTLVTQIRAHLATTLAPDGFNIGLNDGPAAGQTVMHAHVHIIPRHHGDTPDPRGGIRWVLAKNAAYWKT